MIYSIFSILVALLYPVGSDLPTKIVFAVSFTITILISIVMLPISIRLAAQLIMQVLKYRYIVREVATQEDDNKVMNGYYQHFKTIMFIVLSMVGFNVFNVLSAVYFLVYVFKSDWGNQSWSKWIVEGMCASFQECIILFAISMLYHIACYFRGDTFRFYLILIVIAIRFLYVFLQVGMIANFIMQYLPPHQYLSLVIISRITMFIFILLSIVEIFLRIPTVFSFVRVTQREVSNYIREFREDIMTSRLDENHYADKVNAGTLFQIAGWGTIFVSFLTSFSGILQFIAIFVLFVILSGILVTILPALIYTFLIIIQIVTILPSILYLAFLIILWLYFRYKTKVKYNGYSSNDPLVTKLVHGQNEDEVTYTNQDALHHTFYKHKNRVFLTTYVVVILLVSVTFSVFLGLLITNQWENTLRMKPGDYYLLNGSELSNRECPNFQFFIAINEDDVTNPYTSSSGALNCSESIVIGKYNQSQSLYFRTFNYTFKEEYYVFSTPGNQIWIPDNSTLLASVPNYYHSSIQKLQMLIKTKYPCYVAAFEKYYDNQFGVNVCENPIIDQNFTNSSECKYINNNTQIYCTINYSGVYYFGHNSIYYENPITWGNQPIIVNQFGRKVNESTLVPLANIKSSEFKDNDLLLFQSPQNIVSSEKFCTIKVTCQIHTALRVLIPILILIGTMTYLIISIYLIYKI